MADLKSICQETSQGLQKVCEQHKVEYLRFELCSVHGASYGKLVPAERASHFLKTGLNMLACNWAICASGHIPTWEAFANRGMPDGMMFSDPSTFVTQIPWSEGKVGRVIMEPYLDNVPLCHPRFIARNLLRKLANEERMFKGAFEYEFQAFDRKPENQSLKELKYFTQSGNQCNNEKLLLDTAKYLKGMGININTMNGEYAEGQQEWTLCPSWEISVADDAFTFKNSIKEIFLKRGMDATFLTRIGPEVSGCNNGGHFNFSIWNNNKEKCDFWNGQ
eukprot:UN24622